MFLHFPYHHYQADAQHTSITFHVWFAHVAVVFRPNFINNYVLRTAETATHSCVGIRITELRYLLVPNSRFHKKH